MRSLLVGVLIGLVASGLFVAGFAAGTAVQRAQSPVASSDHGLNDFLTAYKLVTEHSYYRPVNRQRLIYGAINGMMAATGDPHTYFLSPQEDQQSSASLNGSQYAGIGAIVIPNGPTLRILTPLPNSPAGKAGLKPGDLITRIDGKSVAHIAGDNAIARIHGAAGSTVRLTIRRQGLPDFPVNVRRAQIPPTTAFASPLEHRLAYVDIFTFGGDTADEVARALRSPVVQNARGIVLDLRGNPGGYVTGAQAVVSDFVGHGVVAYEKTSDGRLHPLAVTPGHILTRLPVAVLVDGGTASAAEITAAALRDDDHAVLIGTRTYGKGSMQSVYTLSDGSSVRVTDRLWLTPTKHSIQTVGLKPDILIAPGSTSRRDQPLDTAERYLTTHAGR